MRPKWFSKRALLWHLALIIWVPGCAIACWWQVTIALSGDSLGWLYSVEWPVFGVFGIFFWWHVLHDDPATVGIQGLHRAQVERDTVLKEQGVSEHLTRDTDDEDEELSAYNNYLAQLSAQQSDKSWRKS